MRSTPTQPTVTAPIAVPPPTHALPAELLSRRVRVLVVGCGGSGSAVATGLAYLHQAMVALGHPGGLAVTLMDDDVVTATNCVRQPFSLGDVGLHKAIVLANRMNCFWGSDWQALPARFTAETEVKDVDLMIGCVDTRAARQAIATAVSTPRSRVHYWLDLGNTADGGQFVLGEPANGRHGRRRDRLRTVAELYPEIVDPSLDGADGPTCSAIEALERQEPFVNQAVATHALSLLARLFRHGAVAHQGGFVNLATGRVTGIPVGMRPSSRITSPARRVRAAAAGPVSGG